MVVYVLFLYWLICSSDQRFRFSKIRKEPHLQPMAHNGANGYFAGERAYLVRTPETNYIWKLSKSVYSRKLSSQCVRIRRRCSTMNKGKHSLGVCSCSPREQQVQNQVFQNSVPLISISLSIVGLIFNTISTELSSMTSCRTSRYFMACSDWWYKVTGFKLHSLSCSSSLCLCLYFWLWFWYWDPVEASKELLVPFCTLYGRFNPAFIAESKPFHAWNYSIQYLEWINQHNVIPRSWLSGETIFKVKADNKTNNKCGIPSKDNKRFWWEVFYCLDIHKIIIRFPEVKLFVVKLLQGIIVSI